MVVEDNFSVMLWAKTGILSLNSELDQAEQKVADHDEEIKEIKKNQDMIDSILVQNSEAIKRIESEIPTKIST